MSPPQSRLPATLPLVTRFATLPAVQPKTSREVNSTLTPPCQKPLCPVTLSLQRFHTTSSGEHRHANQRPAMARSVESASDRLSLSTEVD